MHGTYGSYTGVKLFEQDHGSHTTWVGKIMQPHVASQLKMQWQKPSTLNHSAYPLGPK
jgi:hypothetical protein